MRHRKGKDKLGITTDHRKALLRNLVRSLVLHKKIKTTVRRAKAASSMTDKMIQLAKRGDLHARRTLISHLGCPQTADTLITKIAPHFKSRQGGYTRVLRIGYRPGDTADVAILEFTERVEPEKKPRKPKKAKAVKADEVHEEKIAETKKAKKSKKESEAAAEEKSKKTAGEAKDKETDDKKESEKKGGFLGALRQFLKGDQK